MPIPTVTTTLTAPPSQTIFQMSDDDMRRLLLFLRSNTISAVEVEKMDTTRLRIRLAEYLMSHGLSTLHKFQRNPNRAGIERSDNNTLSLDFDDFEWVMPEKEECQTCNRYRVGRNLSIYGPLPPEDKNGHVPPLTDADNISGDANVVVYGYTPYDKQTPRFFRSIGMKESNCMSTPLHQHKETKRVDGPSKKGCFNCLCSSAQSTTVSPRE